MLGYAQIESAAELAAYAGEHLLIIGPPGTGKTLFADRFFSRFEGRVFAPQLSRWADETVLFGPPNLATLRRSGRLSYDAEGSVLDAEWLFLDELFDAADILLRTLLGILQERRFRRPGFSVAVPLQMAIATSNYFRLSEQSAAVIDRFALRITPPALSADERRRLWSNEPLEATAGESEPISLAVIQDTRERAQRVLIPQPVVGFCLKFAETYKFSPRRERKAAWLLRVRAAMDYRTTAELEDAAAVLPLLLPLQEDLATAQAQEQERLNQSAVTARAEMAQINSLFQIEVPEGQDLDTLRAITRQIAVLRRMEPVSDRVATERNDRIASLQEAHHRILKKLGVLLS